MPHKIFLLSLAIVFHATSTFAQSVDQFWVHQDDQHQFAGHLPPRERSFSLIQWLALQKKSPTKAKAVIDAVIGAELLDPTESPQLAGNTISEQTALSSPALANSELAVFNLQTDLQTKQTKLNTLGKAPATKYPPYDRVLHFGSWINEDFPNDCYNTRAEVLMRDHDPESQVEFYRDRPCYVKKSLWHDPYTARDYRMTKSLQVDHVVPLKNAYVSGAWMWSRAKRCHYANFMIATYHLIPVLAHENMKKSDKSPDRYLPPYRPYYCEYVRNWMKIKLTWQLELTQDEADGIRRALKAARCNPDEQVMTVKELRKMRRAASELPLACVHMAMPQPKEQSQETLEAQDGWYL